DKRILTSPDIDITNIPTIISNILILLSMTLVSLREEINRIIATGSSPFIRVLDTAITGYLSYATFPIQSPFSIDLAVLTSDASIGDSSKTPNESISISPSKD